MKWLLKNSAKEKIIEKYFERVENLKERMSELRKKSYDTSLIDPWVLNIRPKIKMAQATYDDRDMNRVKNDLDLMEKEILLIEQNLDFPEVLKKVERIYEFLRQGEYGKAAALYDELRKNYKDLDAESKEVLYVAGQDLHQKITEKFKEK